MPEEIRRKIEFRADLWRIFLKNYQNILAHRPETFAEYCAEFRARWIAGE